MLPSAHLSHTPSHVVSFSWAHSSSDSICTAPLLTGSKKHIQFINSLLTCGHSFPSNLTHQPVNTSGAAPEKEGTSEAQLSYSQDGGWGGGVGSVCAGSSPDIQDSDMGSKKKGFSEWRVFTNIGSTDAAVCQGDARTGLGRDGAG